MAADKTATGYRLALSIYSVWLLEMVKLLVNDIKTLVILLIYFENINSLGDF